MKEEKTQVQSVICSNCGGQLEINILKDSVECPFCGTNYLTADLLNESDSVKIEKIKSQTYKEVEFDKLKKEKEDMEKQEERDSIAKFKKSKFSKVLIGFFIFSLLMCMLGFNNGKIMAGIIALIMSALFICSWLMGTKIIKEPKKGAYMLTAIIAFVLIIPFFKFYNSTPSRVEEFSWDDMELNESLPIPDSNTGEIICNSKDLLSIYVHEISKDDYKSYLNKCQEMNFTIDADKSEFYYVAYNKEGYKLTLSYNEDDEKFHIGLDAPLKMSEIKWPNSEIAKLVPIPKSNIGNISWESSSGFLVEIGNSTIEDFEAYIDECANNGFNVNYEKGDEFYSADDSNGNHISLKHKGNNIIRIEATAKNSKNESFDNLLEEESDSSSEINKDSNSEEESINSDKANINSNKEITSNGIDPDFKAAMDSYEAFFDEYVEFIKKYTNSNGLDTNLLQDYSEYMNKYTDTITKFENMGNEEMSTAEAIYYLEVQNRIYEKLLEAEQ